MSSQIVNVEWKSKNFWQNKVSVIRVSEIRVSEIRISSNHHELHGAIFFRRPQNSIDIHHQEKSFEQTLRRSSNLKTREAKKTLLVSAARPGKSKTTRNFWQTSFHAGKGSECLRSNNQDKYISSGMSGKQRCVLTLLCHFWHFALSWRIFLEGKRLMMKDCLG